MKLSVQFGRVVFLCLLTFTFLAVNPGLVSAVEGNSSYDPDEIEERVTESGNRYITGAIFEVDDIIGGDLVAAGEEIEFKGVVGDNAYIAAGNVLIDGEIQGDMVIAAGYVVINGDVLGDLRVAAGELHLNGSVQGDVDVFAGRILLGEDADILGEENISAGELERNITDPETDLANADDANFFSFVSGNWDDLIVGLTVVGIMLQLAMIVSALIAGIMVIKLFPSFTEKSVSMIRSDTPTVAAVGLGTLIFTPAVAFVLFVSVIGIQPLILLAILGGLTLYISRFLFAYVVGEKIMEQLKMEKHSPVTTFTIGFLTVELVLFIIGFVPIIGGIINFFVTITVYSLGVGAILYNKYQALRG